MVTTKDEAMILLLIMLRHVSKKSIRNILKDMNEEVGRLTDNKSLIKSFTISGIIVIPVVFIFGFIGILAVGILPEDANHSIVLFDTIMKICYLMG